MSKRDGMLVRQLSSILPDDRPITAICVVEDADKCPPNFTAVTRTYDLDIDADLWRESGLFIKKKTRYLCFSKTEGTPCSIVENIVVIDEKETPPEGFTMISQTIDSKQRAWRKRQLCYKLKNKDLCSKAVSDIIVCSRVGKGTRMAPVEFSYAGVISGVSLCYKTIDLDLANSHSYANIEVCQSISPNSFNGTPQHKVAPERPPKPKFPQKPTHNIYPQMKKSNSENAETKDNSDRDYEILSRNTKISKPTRPAPQPPKTSVPHNSTLVYGTLPGSSDLDGVPFVFSSLLSFSDSTASNKFPIIRLRTKEELDKEYMYDFRAEKET